MPEKQITLTAATLTIANTACIVWFAHLLFVVSSSYGLSLFILIYPNTLEFYIRPEGWLVNLPTLFFIISVLLVVVVLIGSCIYLPNSRGKLQQLFLLLTASSGLLSYSYYIYSLEDKVYEVAQASIIHYKEYEADREYASYQLLKLNKIVYRYQINKID